MRKKFTSLMLMLFCAVTAWAFESGTNISDLSSLTDGSYVCFKNVGQSKYLYEDTNGRIVPGSDASTLAYVWQVHVEEGSKYSFSSILGNYFSTPLDGKDVYTVAVENEAKDEFTITAHAEDGTKWKLQSSNDTGIYWDCQGARFVGWYGTGANSQYEIIPVSVTTEEIKTYIDSYWSNFVEAARTAAKSEVQLLAEESLIYPVATSTVNQIIAVQLEGNTAAQANEAVATINGYVATYKTNAYKALAGKYFTLFTPGRTAYAKMTTSGTGGAGVASSPDFIWQFVENNGSVNIYNPYIGKYLVMNGTSAMTVTANQAEAGAFDITVASNPSNDAAKVGFKSNDLNIHLNGSLLGWYSGGASEWTVAEVTDFSTMIDSYKLMVLTNADGLAFACTDDEIATVKAIVNGVNTTDFATFAAIDAAYNDAVAKLNIEDKRFTFQATSTDSHRNLVWAAAGSTGKAIGAHDYCDEAVWQVIPATGGFYIKNVRYNAYMGAPSSNCPLTDESAVAYTFELVDKANKIYELKCNGETLHASNHTDDKLLNYDQNQAASRWYVVETDAVVAPIVRVTKEWKDTDDWGTALAVADYPAIAVNEGAGANEVRVREFEVVIEGARTLDVTFAYSTGNCALNVLGVELIDAAGNVVAGDYKSGKTGTGTTCSYEVKVAEAGTYTMRYYVWSSASDRLNATNGNITIVIDVVDMSEFSKEVTFAAEYATLHLGYSVAVPTGVEAYVVSEVGDWAVLTEVEGVIPAATPVILKNVGDETTYTFAYTNEAAATVGTNLLQGSIADKYIADDAYVLANGSEGVGLYKAAKNQLESSAFKNNANKAYLVVAGAEAPMFSLGRGEGTTAIDNAELATDNVVIYDLAGRRVEKMEKGIYIVNGKKVIK